MLEWASPIWLSGIGLLPLVWWLHRFQGAERSRTVSALFLWRAAAAAQSPGTRRNPPDPLWRLRAAILALLFLGAAGPHWSTPARNITLWFDDSLSMWALENGEPRHRLATRALLDALDQIPAGDVVMRSLLAPGRSLRLETGARERWPQRIAAWLQPVTTQPRLPAPRLLQSSREHWLVTDGARADVDAWLQHAPVSRILPVGASTENVALERLALRPSLQAVDRARGVLVITNHGRQPAQREVLLRAGDRTVLHREVSLAARETRNLDFVLDGRDAGAIYAHITPPDALPVDDELRIARYPPAAATVAVYGDCGRHLRAALAAHPGLQPVAAAEPSALAVICGAGGPAAPARAVLRFSSPADAQPVAVEPAWDPRAGMLQQLQLPSSALRFAGPHAAPTAMKARHEVPLLLAGEAPLIIESPGERRIDVRLDVEASPWVRTAAYPALIAGLVERLIDPALLDGIATAVHPPGGSQIAPRALPWPALHPPAAAAVHRLDLAPYLIALGCLLLLFDILRRGAPGGSA